MRNILYAIITFFVISILACKPDKPAIISQEITKEDITGSWNIFHVTRNGKETKSLESGKFIFQADNMVETNVFGFDNKTYPFTFNKNKIEIDGEFPLSMKIVSLQNDTLVMNSKMKVFDMVFYLSK